MLNLFAPLRRLNPFPLFGSTAPLLPPLPVQSEIVIPKAALPSTEGATWMTVFELIELGPMGYDVVLQRLARIKVERRKRSVALPGDGRFPWEFAVTPELITTVHLERKAWTAFLKAYDMIEGGIAPEHKDALASVGEAVVIQAATAPQSEPAADEPFELREMSDADVREQVIAFIIEGKRAFKKAWDLIAYAKIEDTLAYYEACKKEASDRLRKQKWAIEAAAKRARQSKADITQAKLDL